MPVKINVQSVYDRGGKDAFETAKRNAEELHKNTRAQFAERERIIKLQAKLSQTTSRQEKAAIRSEIAERRRGLQLVSLKEREERGVTREIKQQIASQKRLNSLTKRLNKDLAEQQRRRSLLGRAQAAVGGVSGALALGGAAIAVSRLVEFRRQSIELAKVQQLREAQLESTIRSTGGAAGFTADELKKYAAELQGLTNIGDESTIAAQNMLLTFTNIRGDTFPRTTRATLDLATAMANGAVPSAEGLRTAALQLGKALNDPVAGLSALTRAGIQFTNGQKDQIKALIENGKLQEAQAIILKEVEKQFGGSAEAARFADKGAQALANSYGDLKEEIGELLQFSTLQNESLIRLVESLDSIVGSVNDYVRISNALAQVQAENASGLGRTVQGYLEWLPIVGQLNTALRPLIASEEDLAAANEILKQGTANLATAFTDNTSAAEDNADALEDAAQRLEKVNAIRQDFAGNLLDIEERAQEDSAEQWQDYYSDLDKLADDHGERVADLEGKAGKERVNIAKRLQKDLAKLDSDLSKDREKITADTQKKIKRLQQDAEREEKSERRKRQIDAKGDERLFQFELQNLAAEGEALQIQEALKRREIEKQIGEEKRQEEERAEGDDLGLKIERLKQDAEDRLREEEDQARQRREFLEQQAEEDRAALAEQLQEQKAAETENLQERLEALKETNAEKLQTIEQTRKEAVEKLGQELAESKELTETELERLKPIAGRLGENVGAEFAKGLNEGFERNERISDLLDNLRSQSRSFSGSPGASAGFFGATPGSITGGFQHGGEFTVGGSGGPDSQLVQFRATPGERVSVATPAQQAGGGGQVINFQPTIVIEGNAGREAINAIDRMLDSKIQEFADQMTDALGS